MKILEDRIRQDGVLKPGNVLKVDNFLNHQMDIALFDEMGKEWARRFADKPINKILTIEASGIGIAAIVSRHFGNVPVVFAKKAKSINLEGDVYKTKIESSFLLINALCSFSSSIFSTDISGNSISTILLFSIL